MRQFVCVLLFFSCEAEPEIATRSESLGRDQALRAALLAAGEQHRVLTFDPNAVLVRTIASAQEHFVPNSPEIDAPFVHESPHVRLQRAENLITGATRYYSVVVGQTFVASFDGADVDDDQPPFFIWTTYARAADAAQVISFNPSAALQRSIALDDTAHPFAPTSPEFDLQFTFGGTTTCYRAQQAQALDGSLVRVYYTGCSDFAHVACVAASDGDSCPGPVRLCAAGDGAYCNPADTPGQSDTLFSCSGGGASIVALQRCANGCVIEPPGTADHCLAGEESDPCFVEADCGAGLHCTGGQCHACPYGEGLYCGSTLGPDQNAWTLYRCTQTGLVQVQVCDGPCHINPPGVADSCN